MMRALCVALHVAGWKRQSNNKTNTCNTIFIDVKAMSYSKEME